jgi:PAS domain S-box-containing protein
VIFVTNVLDKAGNSYENKELLSQISPTSAAPIYGSTDTQLGSGVVGGRLISFEAFGIEGAKVGLRVLAGEKAEAIAAHGIPSVALFDWRALRRWSISEESLPPESIVRFRVPSFWDEYKWYAIAVISVLMVQSALIVALVTTRTLRKRAEKERRRAQAEAADQEVRLAGIIGSAMDAVISTDEDHRIILFNNAAEKIFGYTEGEVIGQPLDLLIPEQFRHAHQRHMRAFGQTGATRQLMGTSGGIYGRRANGEEFPIEASISQLELHGRRFYTAIMRDITERRRAQEAASFLAAIVESSDDAVFGETLDGVIMSWNAGAQLIYGYSPDEVKGKNISMLVPADRPNEISRNLERIASGHSVHNFETIRRRKDGALIYVALTISPVRDGEGHIIAASTVARDITSRKRAEEALRESEERFRNMADTAPVMIWVSGPDKLCTYFNNRWLDFTGRSIEQEPARGWADAIHPDDYEHRLQTYNSAFDLLEPFTIEYRLRRADGEFRWVLESGTARLSPGGEFLGYIGSCIEITERKEAEQALENLSGQLICAREDECARIARDLHDDINQRVALISLELNQLSQGLANSEHGMSGRALSILRQTEELSTEVHRMSRDLHPSKLVHLGLVAGLKSLCAELSRGHGLKIEFAHADVPGVLPKDVSLCLYRIVQECLNNVIRHSAAKNAFVELRGGDKEIRLVVSDSGSGFDLESVRSRKGIGLIGMRERLRLVGGTISIESQVATGTSVDVRVPVGRVVEGKEGRLQKSKRRMVTVG